MINVEEKKRGIISFLEMNGPSLPVRVARAIQMEPVFASAILSELLNEKKIKISFLRVGSSPLYLISGQEIKLEEHADDLKPLEKGAYIKLKEKKILVDEEQEPAIRVALRSIKDFAMPFKLNEKIMWRYAFISDQEVQELLKLKEDKPKKDLRKEVEKKPKTKVDEEVLEEPKKRDLPEDKDGDKAEDSKKKIKEVLKKEEKEIEPIFEESEEEPEFLKEIKDFLERKKINFSEEIEANKKEVIAVVSVSSGLGELNFLMIAKNKKAVNEEEIKSALQRAAYHKMPCLFVIRKEPTKKIQKILETSGLIKIEVME